MSTEQPDPSKIGIIPQPPLAILPDPGRVFARRAQRLRFLAESSHLAPYLRFLSGIAEAQARLVADLPPLPDLPEERRDLARGAGMPPIDRAAVVSEDAGLPQALATLLAATAELAMPEEARESRDAARAHGAQFLANIVAQSVDPGDAAPHLWAGAAVELHFARLASRLEAGRLVPVGAGLCPCCGGSPAVSVVTQLPRLEGIRYGVCATCLTMWNEVRVKCLACGSTKGIGYRQLGEGAVIKAEVCGECGGWVKILYQTRDTALDPMADDVASLGLNLRMAENGSRRASFSPYLIGL